MAPRIMIPSCPWFPSIATPILFLGGCFEVGETPTVARSFGVYSNMTEDWRQVPIYPAHGLPQLPNQIRPPRDLMPPKSPTTIPSTLTSRPPLIHPIPRPYQSWLHVVSSTQRRSKSGTNRAQ